MMKEAKSNAESGSEGTGRGGSSEVVPPGGGLDMSMIKPILEMFGMSAGGEETEIPLWQKACLMGMPDTLEDTESYGAVGLRVYGPGPHSSKARLTFSSAGRLLVGRSDLEDLQSWLATTVLAPGGLLELAEAELEKARALEPEHETHSVLSKALGKFKLN